MIQVCSRCGTRWNVREQQRAWCPRCHGPLLGPSVPPVAQAPSVPPVAQGPTRPPSQRRTSSQLPSGYRWIAVRPGPPPPPRRRRRPLGPTPRYQTIPRWGLVDEVTPPATDGDGSKLKTASAATVRSVLIVATVVFAAAAAVHVLRYLLLLINRTMLLPPWVAWPALVLGVLVSLAAIVATCVVTLTMTSWLVDRRAAAYSRYGRDDPRPTWMLRAGCLIPVASLFWAPVFLIELAQVEGSEARQRKPIKLWWVAWAFSTVMAVWATWTRRATEPQAIADNTVTMVIAYLAGAGALLLLLKVFDGFVGKAGQRPQHRWVVVADDGFGNVGAPGGIEEVRVADEGEVAEVAEVVEVAEEVEAEELHGDPAEYDEALADDSPTESLGVVESGDREPAA